MALRDAPGVRPFLIHLAYLVIGTAAGTLAGAYLQYVLTRPPTPALLFRHESVPVNASTIAADVPGGSVLYFSGSQFSYQNRQCANAGDLCVFLDTFSAPTRVVVDGVISDNNFIEARVGWSELDVLGDKEPSFWDSRNCSNGCQHVDVYLFRDGQLESTWSLTPPPR